MNTPEQSTRATRVLVVDDSPIDRRLARRLLEKRPGLAVRCAADGEEALALLAQSPADVVVSDMLMPKLDGLGLVRKLAKSHPHLPVVVMTAHGSEETAAEALSNGAASYVPKRNLAKDLWSTISGVLQVAKSARAQRQVLASRTLTEMHFELGNHLQDLAPLLKLLEELLDDYQICDGTDRIQVGVALREALVNAICHGNLEVSSDLIDDHPQAFADKVSERAETEPYASRRVELRVRACREGIRYWIKDAGPGFDPTSLPDPTDPLNLEKAHGRGLMLIRTFMDEVSHNGEGNEIRLYKQRKSSALVQIPAFRSFLGRRVQLPAKSCLSSCVLSFSHGKLGRYGWPQGCLSKAAFAPVARVSLRLQRW